MVRDWALDPLILQVLLFVFSYDIGCLGDVVGLVVCQRHSFACLIREATDGVVIVRPWLHCRRRIAAEVLESRRGLLDLAVDGLELVHGGELVKFFWADDVGALREHRGLVVDVLGILLGCLLVALNQKSGAIFLRRLVGDRDFARCCLVNVRSILLLDDARVVAGVIKQILQANLLLLGVQVALLRQCLGRAETGRRRIAHDDILLLEHHVVIVLA